uniref:Fe2OG dioxygenase domain-containing protein n=1 Tax=Bionectria ochroleuca TaxID=29856 RepID=A0A8H7NPW2_BIOOC
MTLTGPLAPRVNSCSHETVQKRRLSQPDLHPLEALDLQPTFKGLPFRLFSDEAINKMRRELFTNPKIWTDHRFSSKYAECQLRGYARDHAPFIYNAWKSPETLRIISDFAGLDVVPVFDYDIAHINVSGLSIPDLSPLPKDRVGKPAQKTNTEKPRAKDKNDAIVSWHNDSYAFVCVTMLSDCTGMVGGETALRTADGNVIKVRGLQRGYAVVLQGHYIDHQALRALGGTKRVSMVTAFRARSAEVRDDTNLRLVRPISNIDELYNKRRRERVDRSILSNAPFDVKETRSFIREQIEFLEQMEEQIMEEDDWEKLYSGS